VSGFGLLVASVLAGELWDHVSPGAALGLGAALAAAAAVLLLARPGARSPPDLPATTGSPAFRRVPSFVWWR